MEKMTIIAGLKIKQERISDFLEKARELVETTRREEGCLRYDLYRDSFCDNSFVFIEEYKDSDAFARHRSMPYMDGFRKFRSEVVEEYLGVSELSERAVR